MELDAVHRAVRTPPALPSVCRRPCDEGQLAYELLPYGVQPDRCALRLPYVLGAFAVQPHPGQVAGPAVRWRLQPDVHDGPARRGRRRGHRGQDEARAGGVHPVPQPGRPVRVARRGGPVREEPYERHDQRHPAAPALALVQVLDHLQEAVSRQAAAHRGGTAGHFERPRVGLVGTARQLAALEECAEPVPGGLVEPGGPGQPGSGQAVVEEGAGVPVPVHEELRQLPALAAFAQFLEGAVDAEGGAGQSADALAHVALPEFAEQGLGEPAGAALGVVLRGLALPGGVEPELPAARHRTAAAVVGGAEVPAGVAGRVDPAGVHEGGLEREAPGFDQVGPPPAQRRVEVEVPDLAAAGVGAGQHQLLARAEVAVSRPEDPQQVAVALWEFVEQHRFDVLLGRRAVRRPQGGHGRGVRPVEGVRRVERGQQQPDVAGRHLGGSGQPAGEAQGVAGRTAQVPAVADVVALDPGDEREGAPRPEGRGQEVGGSHPISASATACSIRS